MPHPPHLIRMVVSKLLPQYPEGLGFVYIIEKRLSGTHYFPDIQICHTGQVLCVVEIGYTHAQKLRYYRDELRIPDVRFYGKDGIPLDMPPGERKAVTVLPDGIQRYMEGVAIRAKYVPLEGHFRAMWLESLGDMRAPPKADLIDWLQKYGPEEVEYAIRSAEAALMRGKFDNDNSRRSAFYYVRKVLINRSQEKQGCGHPAKVIPISSIDSDVSFNPEEWESEEGTSA